MANPTDGRFMEELLIRLQNSILTMQREMHAEFAEVKQRLTSLELGIAGIKRDGADTYETQARMQGTIDALTERLHRVERRLELTPDQ